MSYAANAGKALDYDPCQYGRSKLVFRGPHKSTKGSYIALIGGSEAYGRFVARPFADLVENTLDIPILNLGCLNAGVDAFLYDSDIIGLAKGAKLTVVQVMGAQNMSNRFYRVHPRRNDRFLGASESLHALYRDVDFTEFSFTRHMLSTLQMTSADRFGIVREELRQAWLSRMKLLLCTIDGPVLLLWLRSQAKAGLEAEPLFVGRDMVEDLSSHVLNIVETPMHLAGDDLDGMSYGEIDRAAASKTLGLAGHQAIAEVLAPALQAHL